MVYKILVPGNVFLNRIWCIFGHLLKLVLGIQIRIINSRTFFIMSIDSYTGPVLRNFAASSVSNEKHWYKVNSL